MTDPASDAGHGAADPPADDPALDPALDELIHRGDLDGLVRLIDAECASRDWAGLLRLRNRARSAVDTGRQLWPAATLAEYRLALWAPAQWAATVLDEDSGRFTIGPLTEVVAMRHSFADLAAHVPAGPRLGFIAHERGLRGEVIAPGSLDTLAVPDVLEIPLALQPWEPQYVVATYTDEGVRADPPPRPTVRRPVEPVDPPAGIGEPPRDETATGHPGVADPSAEPFAEPPRDESRSSSHRREPIREAPRDKTHSPAQPGEPIAEAPRDKTRSPAQPGEPAGEPAEETPRDETKSPHGAIDPARKSRAESPRDGTSSPSHQGKSIDGTPRDETSARRSGAGDDRVGGDDVGDPAETKRHVEIRQANPDLANGAETKRHVEVREGGGTEHLTVIDDEAVQLATRQLLEAWTASSDGRAEVVCVEGDAAAAVAALGVRGATLVALDLREAMAWLAWAGASGGAHGRRRGAAIGRFGAWWLVAALGDALDEWPLPPDDLGAIAGELRWWWWDAGEPPLGWELQLAVEDPLEGYAWAISAHDAD